jgi:hypothetical protein
MPPGARPLLRLRHMADNLHHWTRGEEVCVELRSVNIHAANEETHPPYSLARLPLLACQIVHSRAAGHGQEILGPAGHTPRRSGSVGAEFSWHEPDAAVVTATSGLCHRFRQVVEPEVSVLCKQLNIVPTPGWKRFATKCARVRWTQVWYQPLKLPVAADVQFQSAHPTG